MAKPPCGEHRTDDIPLLSTDSELHYIVGNSTFYGVLLPVERLYEAMRERLGFKDVGCRTILKRNSKKELIEFDVFGALKWMEGLIATRAGICWLKQWPW